MMLAQSTEPQAAQEQEEYTMPHPNMLLQATKHVMEQKKTAPSPENTEDDPPVQEGHIHLQKKKHKH